MAKRKGRSKTAYKNFIIEQMMSLGTYKEEYDVLIDTLAETCALRDKNLSEWNKWSKETGYLMVFPYTNKNGSTNLTPVPFYTNNIKFNDTILKYGKELGLSPLSIKKSMLNGEEDDELDTFLKESSSNDD